MSTAVRTRQREDEPAAPGIAIRTRRSEGAASAGRFESGARTRSGPVLGIGALLLIAFGVVLRLYGLGSHPPGLFHDEAYNGLDALGVLDGARPLYFPENNGREPLFIYLVAATVHLFGQNFLGVRAAAAICGLLTLPAIYLLGWGWANRRVGLLSAAILAVTLWHVHLSRVGFRAVSLPLFLALAFGLGALALRSRSRVLSVAAGAAYGMCFYTYLAARFTPLALLAMGIYGWLWHRDWLRRRGRELAWMAGAALLVLLPMAFYVAHHPEVLFSRAGQVAVWNPKIHGGDPVGALFGSISRTLGMFTWQGDRIWRHNVPHRPVFDPLLAVVFLASVGLAVAGWRRRPAWALGLIWMAVMSLPTVFAEDAPHFLRAVGVLPMAVLLPALALDAGLRRLERDHWTDAARSRFRFGDPAELWDARRPDRSGVRRLRSAAAAQLGVLGILAASAALTAWDYFGTRPAWAARISGFDFAGCYRTDPVCGYWFQAQHVQMAAEINAAKGPVYLDSGYWNTFATLRFLARHLDRTYRFDMGSVLPPAEPPLTLITRPHGGVAEAVQALPAGARITVAPGPYSCLNEKNENELLRLYVRWTADRLERAPPPQARFAGGLDLCEARTLRTGGGLRVELGWMSRIRFKAPLRLRVLARDGNDRIVAVCEDWVGTEYYPPTLWKPGSLVVQHAALDLPSPHAGPLRIAVEVENATSGQPLPIREARLARRESGVLLPGG